MTNTLATTTTDIRQPHTHSKQIKLELIHKFYGDSLILQREWQHRCYWSCKYYVLSTCSGANFFFSNFHSLMAIHSRTISRKFHWYSFFSPQLLGAHVVVATAGLRCGCEIGEWDRRMLRWDTIELHMIAEMVAGRAVWAHAQLKRLLLFLYRQIVNFPTLCG